MSGETDFIEDFFLLGTVKKSSENCGIGLKSEMGIPQFKNYQTFLTLFKCIFLHLIFSLFNV